jgi:AcrR family transcriptional regulator
VKQSTTIDGRETRWADHRSRKRLDLIRSARRSIHLGGPNVAMDVIASDAGTSKSVIYRYFGDKDGLRTAIGHDVIDGLKTAVIDAAATAQNPADSLQAMIRAYLEQAASSPNTYAFVTGSDSPADAESPHASVMAFTRDLGELMSERLNDLDPLNEAPELTHIRAHAAIGFIRSAGESWLARGRVPEDPAVLAATVTSWLLAGVTAHDTTRPATEPKEAR